jgi:hypothetical protein
MTDATREFVRYDDYHVPLLRLLAALPAGQGETRDVQDEFWINHQTSIPPEHRVHIRNGREDKWRNVLDFARNELKKRGLMDMPERGIWRITPAGHDWLKENPDATRLNGTAPAAPRAVKAQSNSLQKKVNVSVPADVTFEKLERIRQVMSPEEFRSDWGALYDRLAAEERDRWITAVTDRQLLERTKPLVQKIQGFLQGKSTDAPKSEIVCDWIFLCYTLELFREGAALWRYVNQDEVNAWQYQRTMKLSAACRTRAGL